MKWYFQKPILLFNILLIVDISANSLDMFLCTDNIPTLKEQSDQGSQKLVYGYINGKKTPCMTEYELRSQLSQEAFKDTLQSVEKMQKKTLLQNAAYRGGKNLSNADLRGMDLQGVDFTGADLRNALLESADLRNAILKNANLEGANLSEAYCKNANFNGANLYNTQIKGTFFQNANLNEVKGLTIENLAKVASLYHTKLEETFSTLIEEHYPSKLTPPKGSWIPKIYDNTNVPTRIKENYSCPK